MTNNIYDITLLSVSNNNNDLYSLNTFNNNLLDYWYFDLDHFPKHFLIESIIRVLYPSKGLDKNKSFNYLKGFWDKLNV